MIVVIIDAVWSRLTKTDAAWFKSCGYVACSLTELKIPRETQLFYKHQTFKFDTGVCSLYYRTILLQLSK